MLSDDISSAYELLWCSIHEYDYSEEYKCLLVDTLTNMSLIMYNLDNPEGDLTVHDLRDLVLIRWARRDCDVQQCNQDCGCECHA